MTRISADCSEWAATIAKIAFNIGSRPEIPNIDAIVAEMAKEVPGMTRQEVVDSIVQATTFPRKAISEAAKKMGDLKREAKGQKAVQKQMASLENHLQQMTLPDRPMRPDATTDALKKFRAMRDSLQKQLAKSEPALAKRLTTQIDKLTAQIEADDFAIPVRREDVLQNRE